ncbi:hypothetical protein IVG45_04640 [Methylomonas sp. LL1]|uniref:hypothetical protein n=1 Tax=Methylomonas sp. LL1 TaxID=2785785 RepID=UPI0018C40A14|nr:hypothetical protein [Methylomonas sp. LL1]QPK64262.1 hypothetical protein IVG45_04640 [Methylomonas sp. LL1]
MNIRFSRLLPALTVAAFFGAGAMPAAAQSMASCTMTYKLSGWSFVYKQYDGIGHISCNNGQRAQVGLSSKSIGFTIGKSEIEGTGVFSEVRNLNEIYGHYAAFEGHAGVTKSVDAQVLTSGEISLALSGNGRGVDIGVTIGALTISPR